MSSSFAQNYVPGHILIKAKPGVQMNELKIGLDATRYQIVKLLMKRANIYLVKLIDQSISEPVALKEIKENPWVQHAQYDHYITKR